MIIHSIKQQLLNLFRKSKKDRHRFLANNLSANIAAQIFSLRTAEERKWTQAQLAHEAGIAQPRIPVYESPDYGAFSLTTLKKFAYAFDLALIVKFVSFDQLASEIANQSSDSLAVQKFGDEHTKVFVSTGLEDMGKDSPIKREPPIGRAAELAWLSGGQSASRFSHSDLSPTNVLINKDRQGVLI